MTPEERKAAIRKELVRRELERRQGQEVPEKEPNLFQKALSRVQDFSEGIGVSGLETYYGMKDLVGLGQPEDRQTLDAWRRAAGESGFGTAGQITGDVAQYLLPAGAMTKATKIAPLIADVTATAAVDTVKLPDYGMSRADRARQGAMMGMGGHVLGKTLGTVVTGIKGKPAAERLRAIGAELTPGQLKEGILRKAEGWTEAIMPVGSKAVRNAENKSLVTTHKALVQKAAPPTPESLLSGKPVPAKASNMTELNQAFDDAYEAAWGTVDDLSYKTLGAETGDAINKVVVEKDRKALMKLADQMENILSKPGARVNEIDQLLRKHERSWKKGKDAVWNGAISDIREGLLRSMPGERADAVRTINAQYGKGRALGLASQSVKGVSGKNIDPKTLASGVKRSSTGRALEEGRGNLQQELQDWTEVVGEPAGVLPMIKRRFIQGVPEGGVGVAAADLVAGNFGYQKAARKALDTKGGRMLKQTLSPYRTTAAVSQGLLDMEEEE